MTKTNTEDTKSNKCLYLIAEKGKWNIKDHLKSLNPIYNGAGWFIEEKHLNEVEQISQQANMRFMEWPLGSESFDELKRRHKTDFFQEKAIKVRLAIDGLKATLGIYDLDNENLRQEEQRTNLEAIPKGKQLLDNIDEYDRLQDQLKRIEEEEKIANISISEKPFHEKLGIIIGDPKFIIKLKDRDYDVFEDEHKRLFSSGGLITGYNKIDEQLYFAKGDFIVVQAMSNHGKSTFMLQMAYRFLTEKTNLDKDPMCIFVTYESMPLRIEEKLINIIGHVCDNDIPIKYNIRSEEKYLYPSQDDFQTTKATFNHIQKDNRMHILKSVPLEKLAHMIDIYKAEYPGRTLILFLDYLQIIETNIEADGWQRIKAIAYMLEALAIKKEIIIISACQVNENRQTREGRDIYNAATTIIDIFNHSHVSLKNNNDLVKLYKPPVNGKNVCTISAVKQKHGSSFDLPHYFLFNGYGFDENKNNKDLTHQYNQKHSYQPKKPDPFSSMLEEVNDD